MRGIQLFIKRAFDIIVSLTLILLLIAIPVLIIIPILIRLTSKGPAVFKQERVGKGGKVFKIYKFRTMLIPECSVNPDGSMKTPKERITGVGRFLRKTSLDELMQLFNVLFGHMSLIGPRPTLPYQVERYDDRQKHRHDMRPGVTGWAQVNGRNDLTWEQKIEFDLEYVKKFSIFMDIKILFKTVGVVFGRKGIEFNNPDKFSSTAVAEAKTEESEKKPMKALVLCGGIPQIALIKELKSRGITTVLADMNEKVGAREYADIFYPVSTFDIPALTEVAKKEKVDFLITVCADQVLEVVARISEDLGLPCYIDHETAVNVSNKAYMKRIFNENDVPTSKHVIMAELDEAKLTELEYPLMVKPVDCYSSRGVRKVFNSEELREAFDYAVKISRTATAVVEEFVEGEELTVDVYVEGGEAHVLGISVSDKFPNNGKMVINRTRHPALITDELKAMIADTAQRIAKGFNLTDTPMLIQLISDGKRISVLEFCARTGGGIKFRLIKKFSGFDVVKAVVDLTLGEKPHVDTSEHRDVFIVNEFIYCEPGVFDHLEGFEELFADGVITEYYQLKQPGMELKSPSSSGDRAAVFTLESDSLEDIKKKHAEASARVKVIGADGTDLARHDLIEEFNKYWKN